MSRTILFIGLSVALIVLVPQSATVKTVPLQTTIGTVERDPAVVIATDVDEVRDEYSQTYPLAPNGRIVLENLNGGVKIAVWDRNEVQVKAVKRAYNRERLDEAKIDISAAAEVIRIRTRYPGRSQTFSSGEKERYHNPATVDYSLTIPRQARIESVELINGSLEIDGAEGDVKGSCINGKLIARGLMGETRLSTVNGSLEATFTRLDEGKSISLNSVNGNLTIIIPSDANAIVRASAVHGSITNAYGLDVEHGNYVGHNLHGQLGTGGPLIKLGNVNGRIQIKNLEDGRQLSKATSLSAQKVKEKEKEKEKFIDDETSEALEEIREASHEIALEAREAAREQARLERKEQIEVRREVDRALREAQQEIQRAQRQVQQEVRRQLREELRNEARGVGSGSSKGAGAGSGTGTSSSWRFTDKETHSFPVSGNPRVHLATHDGTIVIHGWDKSEVSYTATKRAATEQDLKNLAIKTEQQGGTISIIADHVDGNGATDLNVYLPRYVSLSVSSGDGRLTLDGVSGDLTLRTGDGPIEVSNARGVLKLNTGGGPVKVARFEGQLDARTGDGDLSLDGNFTGLTARTGSGSVVLFVPAASDFTIETNAAGVSSEGITISEEVGPSRRLRRWKVGQGGNVFTINTGEGKLILRAGQ